jgi:hypothetical protein
MVGVVFLWIQDSADGHEGHVEDGPICNDTSAILGHHLPVLDEWSLTYAASLCPS